MFKKKTMKLIYYILGLISITIGIAFLTNYIGLITGNVLTEEISIEGINQNSEGIFGVSYILLGISSIFLAKTKVKKGQAAMEFLLTYGWAILAAIITLGVLTYFGVFNPINLVSTTVTLSSPFHAAAWSLYQDQVLIDVVNSGGESYDISLVEVQTCGTKNYGGTPLNIKSGQTKQITITCATPLTEGAASGYVKITYTKSGSSLTQISTGTFSGRVQLTAGGGSGESGGETPICGDGVIGTGETCDDNNPNPGDGCSAFCLIESGWICNNEPLPSSCSQICTDNDSDGYGNPGVATCTNGPQTDCNDNNNQVNPGMAEICGDSIDNNCNGETDEGCGGDSGPQTLSCGTSCNSCNINEPAGHNTGGTCNDGGSCQQFMWTQDVRIDAPEGFKVGKTATITCTTQCYSTNTFYSISVHNGASWTVLKAGACPNSNIQQATSGVTFAVSGTHKIRCQERWSTWTSEADKTCSTDAYHDADEITITVT